MQAGRTATPSSSSSSSSSASTCGGMFKPPSPPSKPLFGSGVLVVDSSDLSQSVCKSNKAFAGFAAWLAGKQTWFSYQDGEVAWRVLGSTAGSQLSRLPVMQCAGLVRGGTHAEPEELARNGVQLGGLFATGSAWQLRSGIFERLALAMYEQARRLSI
jgi:hypothetical protein